MNKRSFSFSNYGNVVLASLVVVILILMIIPLPTFIMDLLLTVNIGLSATLLLVALYVSEPLKIATFPSLLLIATMFRLGLNVASTRLILLQADAGRVIESFGQFVVSGNIIVGAVVFLILTLIQFIVIAKGSERVAEVAARFTLDAMPGRQMAIDAELRSGHISYEQAKKQRTSLHRESQLYGAMDGAMKFVKGDAIAGLIITTVNILGGLAVGTLQMDMSGTEAVATYSVLTIGDGLVSQIPSLLISLSAGFIITRVASEEKGTLLGKEMGNQIISQPTAILWVGLLLVFMGFVPGMPAIPFIILGGAAGIFGYKQVQKQKLIKEKERREHNLGVGLSEKANSSEESNSGFPLPLVEPIIIELAHDLANLESGDTVEGIEFKEELLGEIRSGIYWERGVLTPPVKVKINPALDSCEYVIRVFERVLGTGVLKKDFLASNSSKSFLDKHNISHEKVKWNNNEDYFWISPEESGDIYQEEFIVVEPSSIITIHFEKIIKKSIADFVNMDQMKILIRSLETTHPALVEECYPTPVSLPLLTSIAKRLAEEAVSLRHLQIILPVLADWISKEHDPVLLTEYVRMELKKEVSGKYSSSGVLPVYMASQNVEEEVRSGISHGEKGSFLSLDPETTMEIQSRALKIFEGLSNSAKPMVVLASMDIRRYLRQILQFEVPDIVVLSYQELDNEIQIQPMGEL